MRKVINGVVLFILGMVAGSISTSVLFAWMETERPGIVSHVYSGV